MQRLRRWVRYQSEMNARQSVIRLWHPSYAQDPLRHEIPLGLLLLNTIVQRFFRVNADCSWPVHFTSKVRHPERMELGSETKLTIATNGAQHIQAKNGIVFGEGTILASGVKVISANHAGTALSGHRPGSPIRIGASCWLGSNVVVLPETTIGSNSVVAAGAVVANDVASGVVVAGVPARVVKERDDYPTPHPVGGEAAFNTGDRAEES